MICLFLLNEYFIYTLVILNEMFLLNVNYEDITLAAHSISFPNLASKI